MKSLARSVIVTARFLELSGDDSVDPDFAVKALESIDHELRGIGEAERAALREALGELVEKEQAGPSGSAPRWEVIEFYQSFMENFGLEQE
jgi:hypothetical protein